MKSSRIKFKKPEADQLTSKENGGDGNVEPSAPEIVEEKKEESKKQDDLQLEGGGETGAGPPLSVSMEPYSPISFPQAPD